MTDAEIIEKLGGTTEVASALAADPRVISNWKKRGISGVGKYLIKELAEAKRLRLPKDFMTRKFGKIA